MFVAAPCLDKCGSGLAATFLDEVGQSYPQALANMTYLAKQARRGVGEDPDFGPGPKIYKAAATVSVGRLLLW